MSIVEAYTSTIGRFSCYRFFCFVFCPWILTIVARLLRRALHHFQIPSEHDRYQINVLDNSFVENKKEMEHESCSAHIETIYSLEP